MIDPLLPEPLSLGACQVQLGANAIVILARTTALSSSRLACGHSSSRVHSRYTRNLTDLPWHDRPVRLVLTVRRFFCDTAECHRQIFAERVPTLRRSRGSLS